MKAELLERIGQLERQDFVSTDFETVSRDAYPQRRLGSPIRRKSREEIAMLSVGKIGKQRIDVGPDRGVANGVFGRQVLQHHPVLFEMTVCKESAPRCTGPAQPEIG